VAGAFQFLASCIIFWPVRHHSRILGLEEESVVLSFRDVETLAGATVGRIIVMRIIMMVVQDRV